jgi:telomerase Cajal body protein 1
MTWSLAGNLNCHQLARASEDDGMAPPSASCPNSNFWHGCSWSPDGSCIAGCRDDITVRVYMLPPEVAEAALLRQPAGCSEHVQRQQHVASLPEVCRIQPGEPFYAWAWHPQFDLSNPDGACIASSSRGQPVHLWDAMSGKLWCTYRTYDHADEVATAQSVCFHPSGTRCESSI